MSDFSQPEYASYVALCRELKPYREFREGDWYLLGYFRPPEFWEYGIEDSTRGSIYGPVIWLPSLSDWLEMLGGVGVIRMTFTLERSGGYSADGSRHGSSGPYWIPVGGGDASTREEAAARLWMAVTKREDSAGE